VSLTVLEYSSSTLTLVYSYSVNVDTGVQLYSSLQLDKMYSEPIEIKPSQTGSCLTCTRLSDWSGNPTDKPTRSGNPADKPTTRPINRHGNPQRLCIGNPTDKPTLRPINRHERNRHERNRRKEIPPINRRTDR
jgi:hypothetical protein